MSEIDDHIADLLRNVHAAWWACRVEIWQVPERAVRCVIREVDEDLLKEAVALAIQKTRKYMRPTWTAPGFRGYLRLTAITTYRTLCSQRSKGPVSLDSLPVEHIAALISNDDPATVLDKEAFHDRFEKLCRLLTEEERTIFEGLCLEHEKQKDVAAKIGKGTKSMGMRKRQILKKCKKIWAQLENE
jgi:DNA-directed RNA polymerase specialized sigma24 family protein